jgi:MarR family 2-MHQ and catechol resistance regulon transcriptional repressor
MKTTTDYTLQQHNYLKSVIAISRTYLSLGRGLNTFLGPHGLTMAQFGVLEVLFHLGPLRIGEIIEKTLSTSGNMTVVIKNLEKDGLIIRTCDHEDKRAFKIDLSAKGQALITLVFNEHLLFLESFFSHLESEELNLLRELLKKLNGL